MWLRRQNDDGVVSTRFDRDKPVSADCFVASITKMPHGIRRILKRYGGGRWFLSRTRHSIASLGTVSSPD